MRPISPFKLAPVASRPWLRQLDWPAVRLRESLVGGRPISELRLEGSYSVAALRTILGGAAAGRCRFRAAWNTDVQASPTALDGQLCTPPSTGPLSGMTFKAASSRSHRPLWTPSLRGPNRVAQRESQERKQADVEGRVREGCDENASRPYRLPGNEPHKSDHLNGIQKHRRKREPNVGAAANPRHGAVCPSRTESFACGSQTESR